MPSPAKSERFKITYGGWYQRTTLHLSEIYNFLAFGRSALPLSESKLKQLHADLELESVTREVGYLEFVQAKTRNGIHIRYYEDGLYVLEIESDTVKKGQELLAHYFEHVFNPAISYIFSLGAPTPKVLANIRINHPTVVVAASPDHTEYKIDSKEFGEVYNQITSKDITVYKTHDYIFIVRPSKTLVSTELVEMQIFFREFKDQLEKYLNIHRKIWEEITDIKERKTIRGGEIEAVRAKLDRYQKTISLISNRINQMGSYVSTRSSLSKQLEVEDHLSKLFQYKFETLNNTHAYIKEIWAMTKDYLSSAIQVLVELKNQSTKNSITSLTVITTVGVISGLLGYLSTTKLPSVTSLGVAYYLILIAITWGINLGVGFIFRKMRYKLTMSDTAKDL